MQDRYCPCCSHGSIGEQINSADNPSFILSLINRCPTSICLSRIIMCWFVSNINNLFIIELEMNPPGDGIFRFLFYNAHMIDRGDQNCPGKPSSSNLFWEISNQ